MPESLQCPEPDGGKGHSALPFFQVGWNATLMNKESVCEVIFWLLISPEFFVLLKNKSLIRLIKPKY